MHTAYQRVSVVSGYLMSCAMALVAIITLVSLPPSPTINGALQVRPVKVYSGRRSNDGVLNEYASFKFSYDADLRPLFDWNTKQLFVYLVVDYVNTRGVQNEVVIWDRIVKRKDDARLRISGRKSKYTLKEFSRKFENASDVGFTMRYNLMPHMGILKYGEAGTARRVALPPIEPKLS